MLVNLATLFLQMGPYYDGHDHMGWDDGWGVTMFFAMALFWLGVLALGAWTVHRLTSHRPTSPSGGPGNGDRPEPIAIARERLARGEITVEQFEDIRTPLV